MCDRFPWKFHVQTSYKPSNYVLGLIPVVNIKFPRTTYHTIVPSTEGLYCLNRDVHVGFSRLLTLALWRLLKITRITTSDTAYHVRDYLFVVNGLNPGSTIVCMSACSPDKDCL